MITIHQTGRYTILTMALQELQRQPFLPVFLEQQYRAAQGTGSGLSQIRCVKTIKFNILYVVNTLIPYFKRK